MRQSLAAVIVGGGPAGIITSYFLGQRHIPHVVLEKDRAFSEWYGRWDSFRMNTANWMNDLPGAAGAFAAGASRDGLGSKGDALRYFEAYLATVKPPLREGTEATTVQQTRQGNWRVETPDGRYEAANVVICTGSLRRPRVPSVAAELPSSIPQFHSRAYRRPAQVTTKRALIVGSGSSGIQICEDLARSSRFERLTFAVSGNLTVPLKLMGIPIFTILHWLRLLDFRPNSWLGRRLLRAEKGDPTLPPSPKDLSERYGVELVGKVSGLAGGGIRCADGSMVRLEALTVVWCTGFYPAYDFVHPLDWDEVFDGAGQPCHERGLVASAPGLYFVGLRFQHTVASQSLYGMVKDAQYVAEQLAGSLLA